MRAADRILADIQDWHRERRGHDAFEQFKAALIDVTEHQRRRSCDQNPGPATQRPGQNTDI